MISNEIYIAASDINEYKIKNVKIVSIVDKDISNLKVFINNTELTLDVDYILEDNLLKFIDRNLIKGDKLCIRDSISIIVKKIASKNTRDFTCVHHIFSSAVKYKFNHNYKMIFLYDLEDETTTNFLTRFNPFFTSVQKIRMDVGGFLDGTADEIIARIIYDNSKLASELTSDKATTDTDAKTPIHVKNFVRYKTDIDLCNAAYLTLSGRAGSVTKSIGDLNISKDIKIPYLKDLLKKFEELLKPNEELISGKYAQSKASRKANSKEYPISKRGIF